MTYWKKCVAAYGDASDWENDIFLGEETEYFYLEERPNKECKKYGGTIAREALTKLKEMRG